MPDKIQVLYDAVSSEYDLGSLNEFKSKMADPGKRKALYDAIGKDYDLGTFDDFNRKIAPSGPVAAAGPVMPSTLPTFQEQVPMMQTNRFTDAVKEDKKKSGSYIGAIHDSFVSALDPIMYAGDELFIDSYEFLSGKKLDAATKKGIRTTAETIRQVAPFAGPKKTQDKEYVQETQGGWDMRDGFGVKDMKALGLMGSRVAGDLAIAAAAQSVGVPMGSTYFVQGAGSGYQEYNEMVDKGIVPEDKTAKNAYALTTGVINGLLEKYAFDKIFGSGPAFTAVKKKVTAEVLKQVSKATTKITVDTIEKTGAQLLKKELSGLGRKAQRAGFAAGVEALTEGSQTALEEGAKFLTNAIQGGQIFDEEDIKKNIGWNVFNAAVAGGLMGGPMGIANTMMTNVDNTLVKEIANAKNETELNQIIQELEQSMTESNASEEEIAAMRQSAVKYNDIYKTIPQSATPEAKANIIGLIDRRNGIDEKMSNWQAELEQIDESMRLDVESEMNTLVDAKDMINDEIRENASQGKFKYFEDKGKFFKQFEETDPIEISKSRYELQNIKDNATPKSQEQVQEVSTESDISQPEGTQGVQDQEANESDAGYRYIIGEEGDEVPVTALINKKVRINGQPAILYKEGRRIVARIIGTNRILDTFGTEAEMMNALPEQFGIEVDDTVVSETPSGGYRVEGQDLSNTNENPADAISYDQNGKVMNVVLTTAAGKRRKFRGTVAQDLAYQITLKEALKNEDDFEAFLEQEYEQELENARLQAAAQEQAARAAEPVPEPAQAEPTVEPAAPSTTVPTYGRITRQSDDSRPVKGRLAKKLVADAKRVLSSLYDLGDFSVNIHDQNSFEQAVLEAGGSREDAVSRGFYLSSNGEIHINIDNAAPDTVLHEGFHPILDFMAERNPQIVNNLFNELSAIPEAAGIIEMVNEQYDGEMTQKKEAITNFVAAVANGDIVVNPSNFAKIRRFIANLLKKLGLPIEPKTLLEVNNPTKLVELSKFISEAFETGDIVVGGQLEQFANAAFSPESGGGADMDMDIPTTGSGRKIQFSKETLGEARRYLKSPEELAGTKISRTVFYDLTKAGKLDIKNILNGYTPDVNGKGGPFYSYMKESVDNNAVLAFTRLNPAIQSLNRQLMFPDAVHAVASQNPLTAHLGNLSTYAALFDKDQGIFQRSVKNRTQERELLGAMLGEIEAMSKRPDEVGKAVRGILKSVNLSSIKTINDFADNIMMGVGNSFGSRNFILDEMLQDKQTKITKSTRDSHKIIHYKYGIPTLKDIAEGNNQPELASAELGDVIKLVKPSTDLVVYTSDPAMFEQYKKKPTDAMIDGGISIEMLPEGFGHESYPFVLKGENVALLDNFIDATQMYEQFKDLPKKKSFWEVGRMKKDAPAGEIEQGIKKEETGPQFQRMAPNGKPSKLTEKQYQQVRTPEFKKWFGDWENDPANASKVVDENGEPLVVYHGSSSKDKFDKFTEQKSKNYNTVGDPSGYYFASNSQYVYGFAKNKSTGERGRIYAAFLNIRNPVMAGEALRKNAKKPKGKSRPYGDVKREEYSKFNPSVNNGYINDFNFFQNEYIAINSNQIKSATENVGTFSTEDNRIQFQKATPTKDTRKGVTVKGKEIVSPKLKAKAQNLFTSSGVLGQAIRTFKEQMGGELTAEMKIAERSTNEVLKLMEKYKGVISTQDIDNYLTGNATTKQFPIDLATKLTEMRVHIDGLTGRLIDLGVITAEESKALYENNKGRYMLRSYELFNRKDKGVVTIDNVTKRLKNVDQAKVDAALRFLEAEIAADKKTRTPKELKDEAISRANEYLADGDKSFGGKGVDGSVNTTSLSQRSEYLDKSPEIRALMGEYTDPVYRYYSSILKLAGLTSHRAYLNNLKAEGMGKFLFDKATGEATTPIAAEGSKSLAPLNGLYTFPEIKEALQQADRENKLLVEYVAGHIRMMKTVYNPATHVKNVLGSLAFSISNGHWLYAGKAFSYIKKANRKKLIELIDILNREGVLNNNIGAGEINQYFDKFADVNTVLESINNNANKSALAVAGGKAKANIAKIPNALKKAYAIEDDIFKILGFVNEANMYAKAEYGVEYDALNDTQRAAINKIATEHVKSFYPTFSRVPKFVKTFSKGLLLGNFLSFPVESVRVSYNTISQGVKEMRSSNPKIKAIGLNRLVGSVLYNGMISMLPIFVAMASGDDDDDKQGYGGLLGYLNDTEEQKQNRRNSRLYRAPWNKDSQVITTKFSNGKLIYSDIGSIDSYGYQREVWSTFWDNLSDKNGFNKTMAATLGRAVSPFVDIDMTVGMFKNLLDNKDESGNLITNPELPFEKRLPDYGKFVLRKAAPGVVNSAVKGINYYQAGEIDKVSAEAISQLVRTYNVDIKKAFQNYIYASPYEENTERTGFKKRLDNAEMIYTRIKNSNYISQEEKEEQYKMAVEAYKKVLEDTNKYYVAAVAAGVDANELTNILKGAKLGDQKGQPEILSIIQGRYDFPDEVYIRR